MQIIYDKYNDRLILNGYYQNVEGAFKAARNDAEYYVAYDITNDVLYMNFGEQADRKYIGFMCFTSKDKAIIYNHEYPYFYGITSLINTETMSEIIKMGNGGRYWTVGNNIYAWRPYSSGYTICQYNFSSGGYKDIYELPEDSCFGINGENLYYWDIASGDKKFYKLNLSTGKVTELAINVNSENCEVRDMAAVSSKNIWSNMIPISDNCFVFYDGAAKAFRTIRKNEK